MQFVHGCRAKTVEELEKHWAAMDEKTEQVTQILRAAGVQKVVFDITALGPRVALALKVPAIAISNFTFDWIYEAERGRVPALGKFIDLMKESYKNTALWLALPFTAVRQSALHIDPLAAPEPVAD